MGSCCGTQKLNANKNIQGKNQVSEQQQQTQPQPQSLPSQQQINNQIQEQNGIKQNVDVNNDNQTQTIPQTKSVQQQQDDNGLNTILSHKQGEGDLQTNNIASHQILSHNIYSARGNNDNYQLNTLNSNRNMNVGVSQKSDMVNQEQIKLTFQDNQSREGNLSSNQKNKDLNEDNLKDISRQTKEGQNIYIEQQNQVQMSIQKNRNSQAQNTFQQSGILSDKHSSMKQNQNYNINGGDIEKGEQIFFDSQKRQDQGSQNNIQKESYLQMTNTILARSDIYIFSNQLLQKTQNDKIQNKFEVYHQFGDKERQIYLQEQMKVQTKSTYGSTVGDLDAQNNNSTSQTTQFSSFQEWTKLIEKNQAIQVQNVFDKENKINANPNQEIFQSVISMRERAWYDELLQLYKEKNSSSKMNMNMQETIFYKKLMTINDHFRWFVASVANIVFNNQQNQSQFEFPKQTNNQKITKNSNENSQTGIKYGISEKNEMQNDQLNSQANQTHSNQAQKFQSQSVNKQNNLSENIYIESLPDAFSPLWLNGFVWKGVYFRLVSKKKAKHIKGEMKALKHVGLEYLQNDSTFKITNKSNQQQVFVNYILPLLSSVENSSFFLYGTPYIFTKKDSQEEMIVKQSGFNLYGAYSNCYLLKHLRENNLKLYHKMDENVFTLQSVTNIFYIISNARELIPKQCECNSMFVINQDINSNMVFQKTPKDGFIDINILKRSMGYEDVNIKYGSLNSNQLQIEKQQQEQQQNQQFSRTSIYKLDQISFKKYGWSFKMIYMSQYQTNNFVLNKRATELLNSANKKSKEIKNVYGNVVVFSKLLNKNTQLNPALIFSEEINQAINIPIHTQLNQQKSIFSLQVNDQREIFLCKILKKQIESIVNILDKSDVIISGKSLTDLFHKKGINMRYNVVVYSMLKTQKAKDLLSCDILVRVLKSVISENTSKLIKKLESDRNGTSQSIQNSNRVVDESQEKNEIFTNNLFKNIFCKYLGILLKYNHVIILIFTLVKNNENALEFQEIVQAINLYRLRTVHHSELILNETTIIKQIATTALQNSGIFMLLCQQHFSITIQPELERNIRNDKYYFLIHNITPNPSHIQYVAYNSEVYLSIKEIAYLFLIKLSQQDIEKTTQIQLPSALYKISQDQQNGLLSDSYYMPTGEILNNLISYLNCIFGNLYSINSDQNFFLDLYIFQLFDSFFIFYNQIRLILICEFQKIKIEHFFFQHLGQDDEEFVKNIMNEKIQPFLQNSYTFSAEMAITIYTWIGILYETKSLLECEQSYTMALLAIHKLYGDPRGRGSTIVPWELFIVWRLSIISRLQGKKHDAEYVEELYDSIQFSMQKNNYNFYKFNHYIYSDPFKSFELSFNPLNYEREPPKNFTNFNSNKNNQNSVNQQMQNDQQISQIEDKLPFAHWTSYQSQYDENSLIIDILSTTLRKNNILIHWMIQNLLIFQESGVIWEISSLRAFQLSIMSNVFQGNSQCSSVSSLSQYEQSTPKSQRIEYKNKGFVESNQSGNIVQILEKDYSTFSKKNAIGVMFSWGQSTEGQMGNVYDATVTTQSKKIKVNFPKLIIPLKDTIVTSVACGYQHSIAITYAGTVLAWGDNSHSQLGMGEKSPQSFPFPTPIPQLYNIQAVQCGSEHTLALDYQGQVFSWGNGEGGLLGHGDEEICYIPKVIESLKGLEVDFIVCGGLHSLVLTKNKHVYSWGRNEGGQLGIEKKYFTNEKCYLTLPRRVQGNLEGVNVIQIAAGEAHSLALALNGQVYGWGYNMNGQIGLGIQNDTYPVYEPLIVPQLSKIEKIYSGQTFSMFMNQQKEILCCGLNDSNQLGLEKEPIKITSTSNNILDQYKPQDQKKNSTDVFIPKKMDCFHQIPVLQITSGHNHSLALVLVDKNYMLFAWGMHKHGQLGIGETGQNSSVPRPITYLQDVKTYSMACGSYHSLVVVNDVNRILKKDFVRSIKESLDKQDSKWNFSLQMKDNRLSNISELNMSNHFENVTPSEEGKIDNPKSIQKSNQFYALGVKFS